MQVFFASMWWHAKDRVRSEMMNLLEESQRAKSHWIVLFERTGEERERCHQKQLSLMQDFQQAVISSFSSFILFCVLSFSFIFFPFLSFFKFCKLLVVDSCMDNMCYAHWCMHTWYFVNVYIIRSSPPNIKPSFPTMNGFWAKKGFWWFLFKKRWDGMATRNPQAREREHQQQLQQMRESHKALLEHLRPKAYEWRLKMIEDNDWRWLKMMIEKDGWRWLKIRFSLRAWPGRHAAPGGERRMTKVIFWSEMQNMREISKKKDI